MSLASEDVGEGDGCMATGTRRAEALGGGQVLAQERRWSDT
jgi:hypothetical protein